MQNASTFQLSMFNFVGAMALSTTMAMSLSGCPGDEFTVGPPDPDAGMDAGDGGHGGDGGTGGDGGGPILGTQYIPIGVRPTLAQKLPPVHAFLLWSEPTAIPDGKTIDHYDVCWATGIPANLGNESDCPNAVTTPNTYSVIDSLKQSTLYFWKIRTGYNDGATSYYSSGLSFSTDDSVVAWLRMDEVSGTTAADASGKGNSGSLKNGASFAAGFNGNALQCDGTDDYADMGNKAGLELAGRLTVSAWVKGNGIPTSTDSGILNLGTLNYALTYNTNSQVYFYIGDGGNSATTLMSPNVWHHVVGSFDGTTLPGGLNLYLDGVLADSTASTTTMTGAAANLWLGRYSTSYFKGLIDDVVIYGATLDDKAVLNDYCAAQALSGGTLPAPCKN